MTDDAKSDELRCDPEDGNPNGELDDEGREGGGVEVLEEFHQLGRRLGAALHGAWESEDRKRLEGELMRGLRKAGNDLQRVGKDAAASPAMDEVKRGASTAGREIRDGLLSGLRLLNRELDATLGAKGEENPPTDEEPSDG